MKSTFSTIPALIILLVFTISEVAASEVDTTLNRSYYSKVYLTNASEGGIFSTASINNTAESKGGHLTTLRFSYFVNTGVLIHYDPSVAFGVFSGLELKNIGFIEKNSEYTFKRRVYTIGIPVGFKLGDMGEHAAFFFAGTGIDIPVNYREKRFVARNNKQKFNEWFSDRTPAIMPYVFAGYKFSSQLNLKFQYYPGNFFNTSYTDENQFKPYQNYKVHLMYLSVGYSFRYGRYSHWKGKWIKRAMI